LTPESEDAGRELSVRALPATASFRLRGLEEGGLGGKGLLNLPGEGTTRLGSEEGSFSLECLCLPEGRVLAELGEGRGLGWPKKRVLRPARVSWEHEVLHFGASFWGQKRRTLKTK